MPGRLEDESVPDDGARRRSHQQGNGDLERVGPHEGGDPVSHAVLLFDLFDLDGPSARAPWRLREVAVGAG